MLFDENYNLAATQSLKNKDIPEGGAKGTILPSLGADPRQCFEKYVDVCNSLDVQKHELTLYIGDGRPPHPWKNTWDKGIPCRFIWEAGTAVLRSRRYVHVVARIWQP